MRLPLHAPGRRAHPGQRTHLLPERTPAIGARTRYRTTLPQYAHAAPHPANASTQGPRPAPRPERRPAPRPWVGLALHPHYQFYVREGRISVPVSQILAHKRRAPRPATTATTTTTTLQSSESPQQPALRTDRPTPAGNHSGRLQPETSGLCDRVNDHVNRPLLRQRRTPRARQPRATGVQGSNRPDHGWNRGGATQPSSTALAKPPGREP